MTVRAAASQSPVRAPFRPFGPRLLLIRYAPMQKFVAHHEVILMPLWGNLLYILKSSSLTGTYPHTIGTLLSCPPTAPTFALLAPSDLRFLHRPFPRTSRADASREAMCCGGSHRRTARRRGLLAPAVERLRHSMASSDTSSHRLAHKAGLATHGGPENVTKQDATSSRQ